MENEDFFREQGVVQCFIESYLFKNDFLEYYNLTEYNNKLLSSVFIIFNISDKLLELINNHEGKLYIIICDNINIKLIKKKCEKIWCISDEIKDCLTNKYNISECIFIEIKYIHFLTHKKSLDSFYNDIINKTIVICGPSVTKNKNQGKYIDSFNFVIRINKCWKIMNDDYGEKIDMLVNYNTEKDDGEIIPEHIIKKIKYLFMPYPKLTKNDNSSFKNGNERYFSNLHKFKNINKELQIIIMDKEKYLLLEKELGTRPNSGFIIKYFISNIKYKKLFLTGFSFYEEGLDLNYIDIIDGKKCNNQYESEKYIKNLIKKSGIHDQNVQMIHCSKLFLNNDKILMDGYYLNLLKNGCGENKSANIGKKILFIIVLENNFTINEIIDEITKNKYEYCIIDNRDCKNSEKFFFKLKNINIENYDFIIKINDNVSLNIDNLINKTYFGSYDYYGLISDKNIQSVYPLCDDQFYIISKKGIKIIINNEYDGDYESRFIGSILRDNNILPRIFNNICGVSYKVNNIINEEINLQNLNINQRIEQYLKCFGNIDKIQKIYQNLKNKSTDECFILGTGRSINDINLELLENKITLIFNSFQYGLYKMNENINFTPDILCLTNSILIYLFFKDNFRLNISGRFKAKNILILDDGASSWKNEIKIYIKNVYVDICDVEKSLDEFINKNPIYIIEDIDNFKILKELKEKKDRDLSYRKKYKHVIQLIGINIGIFMGCKKFYFCGCDLPIIKEHFYNDECKNCKNNIVVLNNKDIESLRDAYSLRIEQFKYASFFNLNGLKNLPMKNIDMLMLGLKKYTKQNIIIPKSNNYHLSQTIYNWTNNSIIPQNVIFDDGDSFIIKINIVENLIKWNYSHTCKILCEKTNDKKFSNKINTQDAYIPLILDLPLGNESVYYNGGNNIYEKLISVTENDILEPYFRYCWCSKDSSWILLRYSELKYKLI
jgi:hypothetical protein